MGGQVRVINAEIANYDVLVREAGSQCRERGLRRTMAKWLRACALELELKSATYYVALRSHLYLSLR